MKKKSKKVEESLTQVSKFQMNEPDHEGEMAKSQMLKTMKYSVEIMNMIDDTTELPAWVQSKLTKIADYIGAVKHYMDSKTVRHVVTNMMEEKEIKLADLVSTPMNEMVSFDDLVGKKYGSAHGNAQHFSRINGKEYTWNYVQVGNGKYSVSNKPTDTIAVSKMDGKILKVAKIVKEGLDPDIAKHMIGIYKGFVKVEGDGTMIYDSPTTAKKAADYLNSKKVAASSDGKFLYIESVVKEGFVTIALGVAAGLLLLKVIKFLSKKLLVGISMNAPLDKEKLKDFLQKSVDTSLRQSGSLSGDTVLKVMLIQKHLNGQIDGGKIKTLKQLTSEVEKAVNGLTVKESVINEGPSSEELRLAKNAIKSFAKYRRVSDSDAYYDLMSALKSLERQYESVTEGKNDKKIKELEAKLKSIKGNTPGDQGLRAAIQDDIERLKNESINEDFGTIALGVAGGLLLIKLLKLAAKKVLGSIALNAPLTKEQLHDVTHQLFQRAMVGAYGPNSNLMELTALKSAITNKINKGEITRLSQIVSLISAATKK